MTHLLGTLRKAIWLTCVSRGWRVWNGQVLVLGLTSGLPCAAFTLWVSLAIANKQGLDQLPYPPGSEAWEWWQHLAFRSKEWQDTVASPYNFSSQKVLKENYHLEPKELATCHPRTFHFSLLQDASGQICHTTKRHLAGFVMGTYPQVTITTAAGWRGWEATAEAEPHVQRTLSQAWENRRPGEDQCLRQPGYWPGLVAMGRRKWQPTPVLLPGESPGQRSLVGYSPKSRRVRHDWATDTRTVALDPTLWVRFCPEQIALP